MNILRFNVVFLIGIGIILHGCAQPSRPTGGPRDETPPEIIKSIPESGTTGFDDRVIELHFNEYIERSTLTRSLSIAPNMGINYELDWGHKSVEIVLDRQPPDSTTFILNIGTELADKRGNAINSPIKIAISTGPVIDKGKLIGRLIKAESGEKETGMKVLLYRRPADLSQPAEYVTETDTGGRVSFPYLAPGSYKGFWVDDRNRNRTWDASQERSQPFPTEFVELKKGQTDSLGTIYVQNPDTSRPELMGVGLLTEHRLRLRFSEAVIMDSLRQIQVLDSTGSEHATCYPLYQPADENYIILAHSEKPLNPRHDYHIELEGLTDNAGNQVLPVKGQTFSGSSQEDTVLQRFVNFESQGGIYHDQPMVVTYAKPITNSVIRDSLRVIEAQKRHESWEKLEIRRNRVYVYPDTVWEDGVAYELKTWNPLERQYKSLESPIWHPDDLGKINIKGPQKTDSARYHLRLVSKNEEFKRSLTFIDSTAISNLPPKRFRVIAYRDLNGNNRWDDGQVDPFEAPEPYFIRSNIPIQAGFTSELTIRFSE